MTIFKMSRLFNFKGVVGGRRIFRYPNAPIIPLPNNYAEIINNETGRFSYDRERDMSTPIRMYAKSFDNASNDARTSCYDCFGMVSLNGSMQSNVPRPYSATGKSTHFNMPGMGWSASGKFIAQDLQNALRYFHTTTTRLETVKLTKRERLALIFKQYGRTIIVFHVTISLMTLGSCYLAVISGLDVTGMIEYCFDQETHPELYETLKTSTNFIIAYTIHKLMAPIRISLTLGCAPLIMRKLRKMKIFKPIT